MQGTSEGFSDYLLMKTFLTLKLILSLNPLNLKGVDKHPPPIPMHTLSPIAKKGENFTTTKIKVQHCSFFG